MIGTPTQSWNVVNNYTSQGFLSSAQGPGDTTPVAFNPDDAGNLRATRSAIQTYAANRLTQTVTPAGVTTTFGYNALGQQVSETTVTQTASSLFGAAVTPTVVQNGSHTANLGVVFKASVSGTVTGVSFYKAATNTGTHVGELWTTAGTLLASATFSGESASGWQSVSFSSPVTITAGTSCIRCLAH